MATITAIVAAVNPFVSPIVLCIFNGAMARGVLSQIYLVIQTGHKRTTCRGVMDLMVTIGLGILINDKAWHSCFSCRHK